jgi:hypothetical protein
MMCLGTLIACDCCSLSVPKRPARRGVAAIVAVLAAVAPAALAQTTVPVEQAPYHVPVFSNEHVTLLDVFIPPGRTSGFHRHSRDAVGIQIADGGRTTQLLGGEPEPTPPRSPGAVTFTFYSREPGVHAVATTGAEPFHNIFVELLEAQSWGFAPGTRDGTAYEQVLDNERVRVWRLALEPGERAPRIEQRAPGLRVVVAGGELIERVPGQPDRGMAPHAGQFFWQDGGVTRAVENVGSTRIELVEIELK